MAGLGHVPRMNGPVQPAGGSPPSYPDIVVVSLELPADCGQEGLDRLGPAVGLA